MPCSPLQEIRLLTRDDFLNDPAAGKGLGHLGRVNAELDLWAVAGQKIALKTGRDVEHQGVETGIHAGIDVSRCDHLRGQEIGRVKRAFDTGRYL